MKKLRKFLTVGVMVLSIIAMSGLTVNTAKASAQAGDLIKMDGLSSIYYLGNDGKRYVFPSESVYFSWYNDFSGVVTISASELQSYPLGSNITMRPGTKLVKITTDPSVYAVTGTGVLRKIQSESDAITLYGTNWAKKVVDVADAFFTNYTIGTPLTSGAYPAGTLLKNANNASVYYYDGTNYRLIASEAAFNANRFNFNNVITTSTSLTASGSSITGAEDLAKPSGATTGPVVTGSGLTVALSSDTPASNNVPKNGTSITFAKVNLTAANDGNVNVNSITVSRTGLSSRSDFDQVWAEKNGVRVTSKRSVNSDDEALLTFVPALQVPAGQTVSLSIVASLSNATGNGALGIASASAVSSTGANVSGSFPVKGNLMSFTDYNITEAIFATSSAVSTVKVGDENVQLDTFTVKASGTKAILLKSITFKNDGNADLSMVTNNMYIDHSGTKITDTATVSDKNVTFVFSNGGFTIDRNESETFKIKTDVIDRDTGNNELKLKLDSKDDFNVVENGTGFGCPILGSNGAAAEDANATFDLTSITAGALTVSKKTTSPSETNYVRGTKNVVALIANAKADEALKADSLSVNFDPVTNSLAPYIENMKVYVNGTLVDSVDPSDSEISAHKVKFDNVVDFNKGDNEVKVTFDIMNDNAADGKDLIVKLDANGGNMLESPEYLGGNSISPTDISGSATGAKVTTKGATLTATRSDGYSEGRTIVKGTQDVTLAKMTLKATNDLINITSIDLAANQGTDTKTSASNLYDFKLFVDGAPVGTVRDFTDTGASFGSLSINIPKDSSKVLELKGSIDNSATNNTHFKTNFTFTAEDSLYKTISVSSNPSTVQFVVTDSGSLTVEKSADTPNPAILVANTTDNSVAKFKLSSTNDITKVTEIYMSNLFGNVADARIVSVALLNGTEVLGTPDVPVNGEVHFNVPTGKLDIDKDGNATVGVKVSLNQISNSDETDKPIRFVITKVKANGSNGTELDAAHNSSINFVTTSVNGTIDSSTTTLVASSSVSAVGDVIKVGSEEMLVTAKNDVNLTVTRAINGTTADAHNAVTIYKVAGVDSTKEFRVRKSVPTVALVTLPNTTLAAGDNTIAKFTVTASNNEDINLKEVKLNISTSSQVTLGATSTWKLKINGEVKDSSSYTVSQTGDIVFNSDEVIGNGSQKTFELIANVTAVGTSGYQFISTKINEESGYTTGTGSYDFKWNDNASNGMTNYFNSYRVIGLPSNTQTVSISL